jgi:hypothetical protein
MTAILASALAVAGCGSEDSDKDVQNWNQDAKDLTADASASTFAGPAPLKVKFSNDVRASSGKVRFIWRFGDGEKSNEQNPTHTFEKPDFYNVFADAIDAKGHKTRTTLVLRAYTKDEWEQTSPITLGQSRATIIDYYKKYPEALPTNPKSDFYQAFPYLRPVLEANRERGRKRAAAEEQEFEQQK